MSDPSDSDKSTSNPLFGAPPPPSSNSESSPLPGPSTSENSPSVPPTETTNPLFGASPPPDSALATSTTSTTGTPAPAQRSYPRPSSYSPPPLPSQKLTGTSPIPQYLRRLAYILSILLGTSAIIAGAWSIFLLPLLHASFSARRALVDQQVDRVRTLVNRLISLRSNSLYPASSHDIDIVEKGIEQNKEKKGIKEEHRLLLEEIPSSRTSLSSHPPQPTKPLLNASLSPSLAIPNLSQLKITLQALSSTINSTSTTRTSLLSTLESYTSHLHTEIYLRSSNTATSSMPVGLGTLGANLSKEGAGVESKGDERGEEWDAVRKEVRAIKGMLLGRRSFGMVNGNGNGNMNGT